MPTTHIFDGKLTTIELKPLNEGERLQFRLCIESGLNVQTVQFEATSDAAMALLSALERLQIHYRWRMPSYRPRRGKPKLSVVKDDES
jgi:hypothetical protein